MRREGFTLIELLVVITVLAILLAILSPTLSRAIHSAQLADCRNNLRNIYQFGVQYSTDHKGGTEKHTTDHPLPELLWRFNASTVDAPFESANRWMPGNPARALHRNGYTQDGRLFFCPLVPVDYETVYLPECPWDAGLYWGTYIWRWRPVLRSKDPYRDLCANSIIYNNPLSSEVVMTDTYTSFWKKRGAPYKVPHHNGLFINGSVRALDTDETKHRAWLYGPKLKSNNGYPL